MWLSFWRDVLICVSGADLPLVNLDCEPQIDQIATELNISQARQLVVMHEKAIQELDLYANPRLLVETLMLQWPHVSVPLMIA